MKAKPGDIIELTKEAQAYYPHLFQGEDKTCFVRLEAVRGAYPYLIVILPDGKTNAIIDDSMVKEVVSDLEEEIFKAAISVSRNHEA